MVKLEGVSKHFGQGSARVDALRDVSIEVSPGEVIGLVGPSGSGKSTLLNVVGCIVEPTAGKMWLDGELVYDSAWLRRDLRGLRLEKVGFIFQFHNLLPFLTSLENVAVVLDLAKTPHLEARRRAAELLDYLQVGHRAHAKPAKLSGGEAQRVAIARALANRPRIILADEPTAALDSARAGIVMDLLRRVAMDQEAAILVVTHDEKVFGRFDRIFTLRDGVLQTPRSGNAMSRSASTVEGLDEAARRIVCEARAAMATPYIHSPADFKMIPDDAGARETPRNVYQSK